MRALVLCILVLSIWQSPTLAHGGGAHYDGPTWTFDLWIVCPLLISGALYSAGSWVVWRRGRVGRRVRLRRAFAYGAGWFTLAGALVSPLHEWGEQLFTLHMIEHEIVMAISAPLFVLARPIASMLWACPPNVRSALGRFMRYPMSRRVWAWLTSPPNATFLHGITIWLWHAPLFFDEAVTNVAVHRFQHLSFFITALFFWWSLLRRSNYGTAAWHLFITMLHTSVLGALMALAPRVLYSAQTVHSAEWGLTPLQDQQVAGMVMWVPAGTVYAGAALVFAGLWISRSSTAIRQSNAA